jgi:hypothetical protein
MQMMLQHARADNRANAPSKDAALREALAWLRHWQDDAACGLPPTPESMRMVAAKISAALEASR